MARAGEECEGGVQLQEEVLVFLAGSPGLDEPAGGCVQGWLRKHKNALSRMQDVPHPGVNKRREWFLKTNKQTKTKYFLCLKYKYMEMGTILIQLWLNT